MDIFNMYDISCILDSNIYNNPIHDNNKLNNRKYKIDNILYILDNYDCILFYIFLLCYGISYWFCMC